MTKKNWISNLLRRFRSDHGNALIEMTIGVSILTTIVLGAAEFGRIAYAAIEVNDAAHAGAAYGSGNRTFAADINSIKNAAALDAPDVKNLSTTATYWCQCSSGGASTCSPADCTGSRIITYITVITTATVDPLIYMPKAAKSYTVTGTAVMRVEE